MAFSGQDIHPIATARAGWGTHLTLTRSDFPNLVGAWESSERRAGGGINRRRILLDAVCGARFVEAEASGSRLQFSCVHQRLGRTHPLALTGCCARSSRSTWRERDSTTCSGVKPRSAIAPGSGPIPAPTPLSAWHSIECCACNTWAPRTESAADVAAWDVAERTKRAVIDLFIASTAHRPYTHFGRKRAFYFFWIDRRYSVRLCSRSSTIASSRFLLRK